jgi:hypothetical protein
MLGEVAQRIRPIAAAFGFPPTEDYPRWQMRRFITLSILLVLGSSTIFIGAASLMKVKETSGHAPAVAPPDATVSKDVSV